MMLLGLVILSCFTISLQFPASLFEDKIDEDSRVFRGRFANSAEFPWMVHLQISKGNGRASVCGGFIISKKHVMTAAHCVCTNATLKLYANVKDITGRIGHINKAEATPVAFSKLKVHPSYDEQYNADIAVLEIEPPLLKFDKNVQPLCIANNGKDKKYPNKQKVVQMGWGRFDNGSVITSPTLKTTSLGYILDKPSCLKEMRTYGDPGQLCVSNLSGDKICGGDSGGPLCIINGGNKLGVGIVSFDYYDWCVEGNEFPAIYTDISYYADSWIKPTINDIDVCWKKI